MAVTIENVLAPGISACNTLGMLSADHSTDPSTKATLVDLNVQALLDAFREAETLFPDDISTWRNENPEAVELFSDAVGVYRDQIKQLLAQPSDVNLAQAAVRGLTAIALDDRPSELGRSVSTNTPTSLGDYFLGTATQAAVNLYYLNRVNRSNPYRKSIVRSNAAVMVDGLVNAKREGIDLGALTQSPDVMMILNEAFDARAGPIRKIVKGLAPDSRTDLQEALSSLNLEMPSTKKEFVDD